MNIPVELVARITASEGIRRLPYRDSLGNETIGIGHNLVKPISVGACDYILNDDIADAKRQLDMMLPWVIRLDSVRYWTLVELTFNMGIGVIGGRHGLLGFSNMLAAIHAAQWANAAESLLQSRWAEQVHETRATRISTQLRTGEWA